MTSHLASKVRGVRRLVKRAVPDDIPVTVDQVRLELDGLAKARSKTQVDASAMPRLAGIVDGENVDAITQMVAQACQDLDQPYREAALFLLDDSPERWNRNYGARATDAAKCLGYAYNTFRDRKTGDGLSHGDRLLERVAAGIVAAYAPGQGTSTRPWKFVAVAISIALGAVFLASGSSPIQDRNQVLGIRVSGCDIPVAGSTSPRRVPESLVDLMSKVFEDEGGRDQLGCPQNGAEQWQSLWIQRLRGGESRPAGFLLADLESGVGVWAEAGIVRSYQVSVKGDLQLQGGLPVKSGLLDGHHTLHLQNGGLIIAQAVQGPAFWIPGEAVESWMTSGGPTGDIGLPMTDVRFADGVPHQDYERGYIREGEPFEAALHITDPDDAAKHLAQLGFPTEGILRSVDGTAWWVGIDGQRHWIPDTDTWHCLGGDEAVLDPETPGWVIGAVPPSGIANCP